MRFRGQRNASNKIQFLSNPFTIRLGIIPGNLNNRVIVISIDSLPIIIKIAFCLFSEYFVLGNGDRITGHGKFPQHNGMLRKLIILCFCIFIFVTAHLKATCRDIHKAMVFFNGQVPFSLVKSEVPKAAQHIPRCHTIGRYKRMIRAHGILQPLLYFSKNGFSQTHLLNADQTDLQQCFSGDSRQMKRAAFIAFVHFNTFR